MAPTTLSLMQQENSGVCNTPACVELSKTLLSNVNLNVDPCSDFFQFTCGNWLNTDPVREQTVSYSIVAHTQEHDSLNKIISLLNGTFDDLSKIIKTDDASYHTQDEANTDKKNFELVKNYYDLCIDDEARAELGATPIFQYVANIENVLLPNAEEIDPEQLARALAAATLQSIPTILNAQAVQNSFDHDYLIANLGLPDLDSTVTYTDVNSLSEYRDSLKSRLSSVLGGPSSVDSAYGQLVYDESRRQNFTLWSSSKIDSAVSNFIDLEIQLAALLNLIVPEDISEKAQLPTYNDLKNTSTLIAWDTFFSTLVSPDYIKSSNLKVAFAKEQLSALDQLLAETPVKTLQEYFVIQTVKHKFATLDLSFLSSSADSPLATSNTTVGHPQNNFRVPSSRELPKATLQQVCGRETSTKFKDIIGRFFALSTFGASKEKEEADMFVDNLHYTWLNDMLPETDWIEEETKKTLIEKIRVLRKRVAYSTSSPDWRSPSALEKHHEGLKEENTYLDALFSIDEWTNLKLWNSLVRKVDPNEWYSSNFPDQWNAAYSPIENLVEIPIGAFQKPFYNAEYPDYMNYGGLGVIVGHEFTHSLDSTGRLYDKNGYKASLFTEADDATYIEKSQCFIDQFSNFVIDGPEDELLYLNGTFVLGENIADNGGIRIALNAYKKLIQKRGGVPEKVLPGFEKFTPEQLFFISHGHWTCSTFAKSAAQDTLADEHAPLYYRNIGAFQNSQEFAKAFNCPVGSPMNPEKKCSLW